MLRLATPSTVGHEKANESRRIPGLFRVVLRRPNRLAVVPQEPCGEDAHAVGELVALLWRWVDSPDGQLEFDRLRGIGCTFHGTSATEPGRLRNQEGALISTRLRILRYLPLGREN